MPPISLYAYVEDEPSAAVAKSIVAHVNVNRTANTALMFRDGFPKNKHGFGNIKKIVPALIEMAKNGLPSLIITDLDTALCSPALIREWAGLSKHAQLTLPKGFLFRIAVREIESWIMADRDAFARFMGISKANFVSIPDTLPDPKQHLLKVIRNKGRKKWHKEMLPQSSHATIGPRYNEKLCEFITDHWNPETAARCSPSLARSIRALCSM